MKEPRDTLRIRHYLDKDQLIEKRQNFDDCFSLSNRSEANKLFKNNSYNKAKILF